MCIIEGQLDYIAMCCGISRNDSQRGLVIMVPKENCTLQELQCTELPSQVTSVLWWQISCMLAKPFCCCDGPVIYTW